MYLIGCIYQIFKKWNEEHTLKKQEHVSYIIVEQILRNKLSFLRYS